MVAQLTITITLPVSPLPLSRCFVNAGRRRIDSQDYKAWKRECDNHVNRFHAHALGYPGKPRITGDVCVDVLIKRPDKRKRDLDNTNKATLDLLVRNYVIEDDSRIIDLRTRWDDSIAHPVVIEITRVDLASGAAEQGRDAA